MRPLADFPATYRTICSDPPWTPAMSVTNGGAVKASPQRHYATMTLGEIKSLPVPAAPQCHLYLWCLSQHVDWGYEVARAWGFEPVVLMTWKKPGLGAGRFRCNTEHFLVARRGSRHGNPFGGGGRHSQATAGTCFDWPETEALADTYHEWPRGRHSEKPAGFFALAERLSPGPRLEMFARSRRAGFDGWGDEYPEADRIPVNSGCQE